MLRFCSRIIWRSKQSSNFNYFRKLSTVAPNSSLCANYNDIDQEHNAPLLMLPEPDDEPSTVRRFYCMNNRKVVRNIDVPIPTDGRSKRKQRKAVHNVELPISSEDEDYPKKMFLSSYGWLLRVVSYSVDDLSLSLRNPFTGSTMKLPQIVYYDEINERYVPFRRGIERFQKFVLSENPTITSDFMVAVVVDEPYGSNVAYSDSFVAFWRKGDEKWAFIDDKDKAWYSCGDRLEDMAFYHGDCYGIDRCGRIFKFEFKSRFKQGKILSSIVIEMEKYGFGDIKLETDGGSGDVPERYGWYYLVESEGRLLMMGRVASLENGDTKLFRIFEVNVEKGEAKEVQSLGNRAIFVGPKTSSVSVEPSHHADGCKPNCVYYTELNDSGPSWTSDGTKWLDWGVYDLNDGYISYRERVRVKTLTPHLWVDHPGFRA